MNRLLELNRHGQSVWLDFIDRRLLDGGGLTRLIEADGLRGVTSNPAIFQKAISGGADYAATIRALAPQAADAKALYEAVALRDIQDAADQLRTVYDATARADGFVSLEVSPLLARDAHGTVAEARRLWAAVDRPNLMIKVPGTPEGMAAIETLIGDGINVNVTLLFARDLYRRTAEAYLAGLERLRAAGGDLAGVASVASFFVSRIDAAVDAQLGTKDDPAASALRGKTAIANACLAYEDYEQIIAGKAWTQLAAAGARPQRLLWASTSTKDPSFRDVLYVETLIGPATVNTLPPATLDAFRDHGEAHTTLPGTGDAARAVLAAVAAQGVDLDAITDALLDDGIRLFSEAFESLLADVEKARQGALGAAAE